MHAQELPLGRKDLPETPPLRTLIGPSFIILGLGLGSGEIVLWPFLASNYGLGIVWGILAGITLQFFINMEVERYALINGESVFVGFARLQRWLPAWFVASTFLGFGWPGIGLYGATLLSQASGAGNPRLVGVAVFLAIGMILTLGRVLYQTVETLQRILICVGVPLIILITYSLASLADIAALARGVIGMGETQGEPYFFLPAGIAMGTFLGALAYAGAGGNLNLAQSCYVRDKGYGMGKYAQRITSLITAKAARRGDLAITGNTFPVTRENLRRFRTWWKAVNFEHLIVFWALGLFTMLSLALLAYVTAFGLEGNESGIMFVLNEARAIGARTLPAIGAVFLVIAGIMLCATQLTVLDSTSRIMTENALLIARRARSDVSRTYYAILWAQILFGIAVFTAGFDQPLPLIVLGAVINAFSMFAYTGMLLWLNNRSLAKELRPRPWRNAVMVATFAFFGFFCAVTAVSVLS